jgi:hypothetical protein
MYLFGELLATNATTTKLLSFAARKKIAPSGFVRIAWRNITN